MRVIRQHEGPRQVIRVNSEKLWEGKKENHRK
jgi:hypothetical protein